MKKLLLVLALAAAGCGEATDRAAAPAPAAPASPADPNLKPYLAKIEAAEKK